MIGYTLALFIGISLGLLGGGGSILTVPILVYVMKMDPKQSIALSLAIVGFTSVLGVWGHFRQDNVHFKLAMIFGPFAMGGTFLGAKLSPLFSGATQLIFFAIIMLLASAFMLRGRADLENIVAKDNKLNIPLIAIEGIMVGMITGLVGVGGGFLIVPSLVLLARIPMKKAVGTSLFIIALNSFTGFIGYIGLVDIPWNFLIIFSIFSGAGIFIGTYLVKYVSQQSLRKVFALFLIVMGIFILYKNRDQFQNAQIKKASSVEAYFLV